MNKSLPKYLYHLTDETSAKQILKTGLIPRIGERSEAASETEKHIYLSDFHSIPYWKAMLNQHQLLRIKTKNMTGNCDIYEYTNYTEWLYDQTIPAEDIQPTKHNIALTLEQDIDLKLSLINDISGICVQFAKYITYKDDDPEYSKEHYDICMLQLKSMQFMTQHMDFTVIPAKTLRDHLRNLGENGCYTLCDQYDCNNFNNEPRPRLWQLLGTHELANEQTKSLYQWLKTTFPRRLRVNTGGWTG